MIHKLREEDVPELIEIARTTWGGHDHLPSMLNHWLEDDNCHAFVMVLNEKIVAVATLKIIDQGKTGWMEGLRVHPEFRKKGLAVQMTNHLVELATKLRISRIRLVTATENPAPRKLAEFVGMKIVGQYSVFWKGYRRNFSWINDEDLIRPLEKEDVLDFVKVHPELVSNRSLIHHWDVFDISQKNVDTIAETAEFWYGEGSGASLSSGFVNDSRYGPEWCFTIYATTPEGFLSNLSTHFHYARSKNIKNLLCIHPPEFEDQYRQVNWLKRRNHGIQLLLFERVL